MKVPLCWLGAACSGASRIYPQAQIALNFEVLKGTSVMGCYRKAVFKNPAWTQRDHELIYLERRAGVIAFPIAL